jgi:hypothetical protein
VTRPIPPRSTAIGRAVARRHACSRANRKPDQVFVNQDATLGMRAST